MQENKQIDKRVLAGALLIVAGGLLFLETFDLIGFSLRYYIFSWKTLLIGIGVVLLSNPERRITAYILIGLGVAFWLPSFVNYNVRFQQVFFPLILIGIGLVILTRRGNQRHTKEFENNFQNTSEKTTENDNYSMDYLDDISILGGGNKKIQSQNFKGGRITAIFGGSEYDFKTAQISQNGCVIDVFTMFGGSKLIVPEDWEVKSDVLSVFGGFTDKRSAKPSDGISAKTIMIKGFVMFGGIEVKNY
jgi:predicted membrane protein